MTDPELAIGGHEEAATQKMEQQDNVAKKTDEKSEGAVSMPDFHAERQTRLTLARLIAADQYSD